MDKNDFPVWRTVRIGTGLKTSSDFQMALAERGCKVRFWGGLLLDSPDFSVSEVPMELDLVVVNPKKIDKKFGRGASTTDYFKRVEERGLELCPAEVGPQLLLQYSNKIEYWLHVGMQPIIIGEERKPGVFLLNGGTKIHNPDISASCGCPRYKGDPREHWVIGFAWAFVRPRK